MKLIIGGAYQGKKQYALENYGGCEDKIEDKIIDNFHMLVLELVKKGVDPLEYVKSNIEHYGDKIIICDDISCGVVPMGQTERKWREDLGRTLCFLSGQADEVVRVYCGLGIKIK